MCRRNKSWVLYVDSANEFPNWVVRICYSLVDPTIGARFFPGDLALKKYPQLVISSTASRARHWLPFVDRIHEKCAFDVQITMPIDTNAIDLYKSSNNSGPPMPMIAICSGRLISRLLDPTDPKRCIYCFRIDAPTAASGITIAIGPYESIRLQSLKSGAAHKMDSAEVPDESFLDRYGSNNAAQGSRIEIFVLPGQKKHIHFSTFYLPQVSGTNSGS